MYIILHEILDSINSFPIKLIINGEAKVIADKTLVDETYLNYEVIKMSCKDAVIVIEAKKYESTTD